MVEDIAEDYSNHMGETLPDNQLFGSLSSCSSLFSSSIDNSLLGVCGSQYLIKDDHDGALVKLVGTATGSLSPGVTGFVLMHCLPLQGETTTLYQMLQP